MPLFQQKYPNNIRTIAGLINPVAQDDLTLLCDTSLGAVAIQLEAIPYQVPFPLATPNQYIGYYNSQYQLYVVDYGNNSLVNNITITAPVGYTINGQPSVTLASNGASFLIVIGSQTNYLALYGGLISGTTPLLVSLTNAQLLNLIATNTVVAGQFYLVTDALGTDGGVIVQGDAINGSSVNGTGLYYNADYQLIGNYSTVIGFTSNIGMWWTPNLPNPPAPPIVAGTVVIWNNQHWLNLTNAWWDGINTPDADAVNWQLIPKSPTGGYIRACDQVRYNVQTNRVVYRADSLGNEVDWFNNGVNDSIADFQWGRNLITGNKVRSNSYFATTNSYAVFVNNELTENSSISDSTGFVLGNGGTCGRNVLKNQSTISTTRIDQSVQLLDNHLDTGASILTGNCLTLALNNNHLYTNGNITISNCNNLQFQNNMMSANGSFVIDNASISSVTYCEVSDITARYRAMNEALSNRKCRKGYSDFEFTLDCSLAPTPTTGGFVNPILVLNTIYEQHYGIINLNKFPLVDVCDQIDNVTTNHPITFYPVVPISVDTPRFRTTPIPALTDFIVSNQVAPFTITLTNLNDSFTIIRRVSTQANIVTNINILQ